MIFNIRLLFVFIFISSFTIAQIKPYETLICNTDLNASSLKKLTTIVRKNACRNKTNDTLAVYIFNSNGQKSKSLNYTDNKLESYTNTTFDNKNNPLKHDTFYLEKKRGNAIITIEYKNNKETKCGNYDLDLKKDTIFKNVGIKNYNKNGDLVNQTTTLGLKKEYRYNNKNQKTQEIIENAFRIDKTHYYYNDNLLTRTENYSIRTSKPKDSLLEGYHNYEYNNRRQLISEEYTTVSSKDKQTNTYEYDSENHLLKMNLKKGIIFMNVTYEYLKNKLVKQTANANTIYGMSELYIPLSSCYMPKNKEFVYEVDFFYDAKNNLTKVDRYLDNDLKTSTEYLLEYY